jgi:hypothetical protein
MSALEREVTRLAEAKRKAVAAYYANPNDETFRAAAAATKAANGGKWPNGPSPTTTTLPR